MWKRTSTDLRHVVARPAAPCRAVRAVPARPAVHGQWPAADRRIGDSHGSPFRRCWNHMISWWNWWNPMIFHASIMFNPYFFWIVVLEDVQMLMMLTSPWPGVPRRAVPRPRCTANGWVFLGKITGHLHISWENPWFPVRIFPIKPIHHSIESIVEPVHGDLLWSCIRIESIYISISDAMPYSYN